VPSLPSSLLKFLFADTRNRAPFVAKLHLRAIENNIVEVKRFPGADTELGWMFENCFSNRFDTTERSAYINGKPDTFVITGDFAVTRLRDSSAQVWPCLTLAKAMSD
jgi:uncharacterized protein